MNTESELNKLKELIDGIDIAMLTTIAPNGRLVSRPLRTQKLEEDGVLWFITDRGSPKIDEIEQNPQVNVAYAAPSDNTYVSVCGQASVVFDKAKIRQLWSPAMAVFHKQGAEDPDLCLLKVEMDSAEYWDSPGGFLGNALYLAMAAVTRDRGTLSENKRVDFGRNP